MPGFLSGQKHKLAVHGTDASAMAVRHCHERGLTNVELGTVHELPFADETFERGAQPGCASITMAWMTAAR